MTIKVPPAIICEACSGSGAKPGTEPVTCTTCDGHGDITQIQRSFLGDIRTSQPCPTCRGFGSIITNPCSECSGEGRVRHKRTINVKIPAGVRSGNRVHLEAQGEVGPGGGQAGDLYVELVVVQHEVFTREGDNLEMVVKVPMTAAALGTTIEVATLEAEREDSDPEARTVTVEIAPGTQSGTRVTLADRGVPRLGGRGRGELGVTLLVQTPTKLDDDQRAILAQLAELRDETTVSPTISKHGKGVFGRLKEAFGG